MTGTSVASYKSTLLKVKKYLDSKGEEDVRGNQTFDLRSRVHDADCDRSAVPDLLGQHLGVRCVML